MCGPSNSEPERLTGLEIRLLSYLVENRGRVVPRAEFLREVWGVPASVHTRTLDVPIAGLRRKLEDDARRPRSLITERGLGYRLEA